MRWGSFDFLRERKKAYQLALMSPAGQEVLDDLAKFCRANETCVVPDNPTLTAVLEGRREVWLRIMQHLNLTPTQLYELYSGRTMQPISEDTNNA